MSVLVDRATEPAFVADPAPLPLPDGVASELGRRFVGRRYVQLVLVLGAVSALGPLTVDTYLPALPTLTAQLGATEAQAQLTLTGLLIGLGVGQLVVGPLSDAVGRRRPLLIGLVAHLLTSVLCAVAPTIGVLMAARLLQGLAGAALSVVGMAIVRDLFTGNRAAQLLSRLVLVLGLAPVLAPSLGSALLRFTSWRGVFVVTGVAAVVLLGVVAVGLTETLPTQRRRPATVRATLRGYRGVLTDPVFVGLVIVAGLGFSGLFAYVAGSPFVLQEVFGLSPAGYGIVFSANAVAMIVMTQLNPALVRRFGAARVLRAALVAAFGAAALMLYAALTGFGGLLGFEIPMVIAMAGFGLSMPNAPALALTRHGEAAGTAAAVLGAAQFGIGGLVSPVVGLVAGATAAPMAAVMAAVMAVATGTGVIILTALRRRIGA